MERFGKALSKSRNRRAGASQRPKRPAAPHPALPEAGAGAEAVEVNAAKVVALELGGVKADLFRSLRTQTLNALTKLDGSSVGLTSIHAGEGKSYVSVNLAASLAMVQRWRVLLVDLDLRSPSLDEYFLGTMSPNMAGFLSGDYELPSCIHPTNISGLSFLPAGRAIRNSSEALSSDRLREALEAERLSHPDSLMIIDLPPILVGDDSLVFLDELDAVLIVVEEGRTTPGELQRAVDLIPEEKLIGTVLNKSRTSDPFPYTSYEYQG